MLGAPLLRYEEKEMNVWGVGGVWLKVELTGKSRGTSR